MALSGPATPRANFATPRRVVKQQENNFATPRSQYVTPKKSFKPQTSSDTPECFSNVTVETPKAALKRRSSRDKYDEESNLTVAVRVRPMNFRELGTVGVCDIVGVKDKDLIIHVEGSNSVNFNHIFQYDHIFWSVDEESPVYSTQEDVFLTIGKPLLNSAFRGYNACLFAYGQTGSGKSFSMMGRNMCDAIDIDSDYSGITPRFCRDLFDRINSLPETCTASVEVSYFEIYNEKIHDLLAQPNISNRTPLKVREHPVWGPYVVDLSVHTVNSYKELRNWLLIGNKNRATAATTMNEKSSRSHSIFAIELSLIDNSNDEETSRRSRVSLVDLAGSERLGNSHNSEEKIRQGVCINKSLLTLGKVISSLADQKKNLFVPYRDSVLTWLLRESLGGNSLTSMLATITPASSHIDETLATLRYACQARSIVNRARINESPHDKLIRELRCEVERLKALRMDYERSSLGSCSSIITLSDSNTEELEELKMKLQETEQKLSEAQKNWEQRFMETKDLQLKELAEAEKLKIELESKVRILREADTNIKLSPFRSNFLEELQGVLTVESPNICDDDIVDDIKDYCAKNDLLCTFTANSLVITNPLKNRKAFAVLSGISNLNGRENIRDFVENLAWTEVKKDKKLSKADVRTSMNQIYEALANLQPLESENNLNLLFAKVNKSLQSFEAALLTSISKNSQKSVTFNM